MEASKFREPLAYAAIGILIAAPIFFALGYSVAQASASGEISLLQSRYDLAKKALDAEVSKNQDLESRILYLETTLRKMTKIMDTVYSSIKNVKVSGEIGGISVTAQAVYIVPSQFCIDVELKNNSKLQRELKIGLTGKGILAKEKETTIYPGEDRRDNVCGTLQDIAANAALTINGKPVLNLVLVAE